MIIVYFAYFIWASRSKVTWAKVKIHIGQVQKRFPKKGRWAHINVKLLHLISGRTSVWMDQPMAEYVTAFVLKLYTYIVPLTLREDTEVISGCFIAHDAFKIR